MIDWVLNTSTPPFLIIFDVLYTIHGNGARFFLLHCDTTTPFILNALGVSCGDLLCPPVMIFCCCALEKHLLCVGRMGHGEAKKRNSARMTGEAGLEEQGKSATSRECQKCHTEMCAGIAPSLLCSLSSRLLVTQHCSSLPPLMVVRPFLALYTPPHTITHVPTPTPQQESRRYPHTALAFFLGFSEIRTFNRPLHRLSYTGLVLVPLSRLSCINSTFLRLQQTAPRNKNRRTVTRKR